VPTIAVESDVAVPAAPLFDLAQDYRLRLVWDPFLRAMEFRGGASEAAVGVRVWVRAKNGLAMEVEYITLRRPTQVAMKMVDGPRVFAKFSGAWLFEAIDERRTRVTFRYNFTCRPRALAWALEPVAARVLRRDMQARLAGLKRHAEAGLRVSS
jgi:ribosome-associated toxin RatA of RatAB toxin-antitoxin module